MSKTLNWGILGAGSIARTFAKGVARSRSGRVVAIGSRSQANADRFGDEMNVPHRHGSYDALLANAEVHAVYIATPHPEHLEWAVKAARAKKHLLCEKPLALNYEQAALIVQAARENDVFLMEAFMYRCHPQTQKIVELVRSKAIGDVRMIQATFGFRAPFDATQRLWANELGGGGILDVGCYPVSMSRLVAGAAVGKEFADPVSVTGAGRLHPVTRVDEYASASLTFASGIIANVSTSVGVEQENVVRIYGTEGYLLVGNPWGPSTDGSNTQILIYLNGQTAPRAIEVETPGWLYEIEADTVAAHLDLRQAPSPAMSWDDTLGNMKTLDLWRKAIGLVYDAERTTTI
jgi:predicted dehydrogenase